MVIVIIIVSNKKILTMYLIMDSDNTHGKSNDSFSSTIAMRAKIMPMVVVFLMMITVIVILLPGGDDSNNEENAVYDTIVKFTQLCSKFPPTALLNFVCDG